MGVRSDLRTHRSVVPVGALVAAGVVAAATLLATGVAGCRQIVGVTELNDQVCGAFGDSGIPLTGACSACAMGSCCSQATACLASVPCASLEACLAQCNGDPACRSQCTIDNPIVGNADIPAALDACLVSQCEDACGLTCGALSKVAPPDAAAACATCIESVACGQAQSCAQSPVCQGAQLCLENCTTGDCSGTCNAPEDDGGTPFCVANCGPSQCVAPCSGGPASTLEFNFSAQVDGMCEDQCRIGNNWWCVGNEQYQYPAPISATRQVIVGFIDDVKSQPQVGVTVEMCSSKDPECAAPLDTQVTNDGGVVTMTDQSGAGNGGDIGLNGFFKLTSPSLYPTTVYWGFPLSEPHGVIGTPIPVFPAGDWQDLLEVADVSADSMRGHIAVVALDCLGSQAPGVTFTATGTDSETTLLYFVGGTLSTDGGTDRSGSAFFLNVPVGTTTVSAIPAGLGGQISGQETVYVRAGAVTEVSVAPTPVSTN